MLCRRYFNSVFAMMVNKIAYSKPKTSCTEAPLLRVDWYAWTIKLTSIIDNCNNINWHWKNVLNGRKSQKQIILSHFYQKKGMKLFCHSSCAELGNISASFLKSSKRKVIYLIAKKEKKVWINDNCLESNEWWWCLLRIKF